MENTYEALILPKKQRNYSMASTTTIKNREGRKKSENACSKNVDILNTDYSATYYSELLLLVGMMHFYYSKL